MLSVNCITKMFPEKRKYTDRGSPCIYYSNYHSRTCYKKGNAKTNDNIGPYQVQLTKERYDDRGIYQKEERHEILNAITCYPLSLLLKGEKL